MNADESDAQLPHEVQCASRVLFEAGPVRMRVDDVRLPSGRESKRAVVEHPGAVAVVALTTEHQVVLVRQWRYAIGQPLLELPAGTCEAGEEAIDTARRELIEETGYRAGTLSELSRFFTSAGYSSETMTIFLARDCEPGEALHDPDESTQVVVFAMKDVLELIESNSIGDAKTLVGLLKLNAILNDPKTPAGGG